MRDRGEVVQCVNDVPSERMTSWGNFGTTGLGSVGRRRFHTCVLPYGDEETHRFWIVTKRFISTIEFGDRHCD